jgi:opacity protein-like surface antigen
MYRLIKSILFFLVLVLTCPAPSAAQGRVPAAESGALGVDFGLFLPRDEGLESGLALEGFYEYYLSARTSVRLGVGWANPQFDGREDDSLRHVRVAGDIVYNWERGAVHPFAGVGLGVYFLQRKDNGESVGDSETKFGGTIFGGAEFFSSRTFALKAEARYHVIRDIGGLDPDGLALMVGVKTYF